MQEGLQRAVTRYELSGGCWDIQMTLELRPEGQWSLVAMVLGRC